MNPTQAIIHFFENGELKEVRAQIQKLKMEKNQEFLYTSCGNKISLSNIFSFNGICW
ncbi:MAG: hypothetical protein ACOVOO_01515 [Flavobacteriales bacterium]|jgi:hypothetical protein